MTIAASDLLFYVGGAAFKKFGTLGRRTRPADQGGEDVAPTFARASVGTFLDGSGYVRTADAAGPRIEWVDGLPYLLLEPAATDRVTYSEQLDNAAWSKANCTISADAVTAPDGAMTADKIVESATTPTHDVNRQITIAAGEQVVWSGWFAGTNRYVRLRVSNGTTNGFQALFDLVNGTATSETNTGSGTLVRATIFGPVQGLYRCAIVGTVDSSTTSVFAFAILRNSGTANAGDSYAGDGVSFVTAWGLNFIRVAGAPTSYIQSVATGGARSADSVTLAYRQAPIAASYYLKFRERGTVFGYSHGLLLFTLGGSSSNSLKIIPNAAASYRYRATLTAATSVSATLAAGPSWDDPVELLLQIASDGTLTLTQSIDGAASTSATSGAAALPAAWASNQIAFGPGIALYAALGARGEHTLDEFRSWLP